MTTAQQRLRSNKWRLLNSFWVLTPIVTFGVFTSVAFLYVGSRLRSKRLLLAGVAYLVFTVFFFTVTSTAPDPPERTIDNVAFGLLFAVWIGGSLHAVRANRQYLVWKAERASRAPWYAEHAGQDAREQAQGDAAVRLGLAADQDRFWGTAQPGGTAGPPRAPAPGWSRTAPSSSEPPPPARQAATTGENANTHQSAHATSSFSAAGQGSGPGATLELNSATERDLQAVPGVGPVHAKHIVTEREARGGFRSLEELSSVVPPHVLVRLREHVVASAPASPPERRPRGRIVDI